MNDIKESLKTIADTYGYESQSRQLIEEMAELTVAINKFWRSNKFCRGLEKQISSKDKSNIIEEIADVSICIEQVVYLIGCKEEVDRMKEYKVTRQLKRMGYDKQKVIDKSEEPLDEALGKIIDKE